ncbi:MAG: SMP-30/gluconolactonase/LRE family protein, partial [Candidatus Promineifilaceae bacterium]
DEDVSSGQEVNAMIIVGDGKRAVPITIKLPLVPVCGTAKGERMKRLLVLSLSVILLLVLALPALADAFPETVPLPTAFQPEGIAIGRGPTFYAGSLADGRILKGNLRTGASAVLAPGVAGNQAVGMSYDARSGYLFVAGGGTAEGRVYDGQSGELLETYAMASGGPADFINDVVVTRDAAYFTNSFAPYIYRVALGSGGQLLDQAAEAIMLQGDWVQGPDFNANGIVAKQDGRTLIVVNSGQGKVFQVDPQDGTAKEIVLVSGAVPFGDGLVLQGQDLYVVQNQLNQISVIRLSPDLETGIAFDGPISSPLFNVPTTAKVFGSSLYVVNAKFGSDPGVTDYEIVRVARN